MRAIIGRSTLRPRGSSLALRSPIWVLLLLLITAEAAGSQASGTPPAALLSGTQPSPSQAEAPGNQPAAASNVDDGSEPGGDTLQLAEQDQPSGQLRALRELAAHLEDLLAGRLDVHKQPDSLFTVDLEDEEAVRLEVHRLQAIVGAAAHAPPSTEAAEAAHARAAQGGDVPASATVPSESSETVPAPEPPAEPPDPDLWQASLEVDRARVSFLRLLPKERQRLLQLHRERQEQTVGAEARFALSNTASKAQAAETARQEALRAAKEARTEAARLLGEEKARLLAVAKQQAEYEAELLEGRGALKERHDEFLRVQRQVREASLAPDQMTPEGMNALYDRVRGALREARTELSAVARASVGGTESVPEPGDNPLGSVLSEMDQGDVERLRQELGSNAEQLRTQRLALLRQRGAQLYDEVVRLNASRLVLLSYISSDKRAAITGLGPAGFEQALGEVEQVSVVLRYHLAATLDWAARMREPGAGRGQSALVASIQALKWLVPVLAFVWWRRRAEHALVLLGEWLGDSRARSGLDPSRAEAFVAYLRRIRPTAEWLLLMWAVLALLPAEAANLLEVKLLQQIATWALGGALVVKTLDSLAGYSTRQARRSQVYTAHLRLRSLRLICRVVVGFGMLLAVTNQFVGRGTIYGWVFATCWFAAVPVLLLVVRWYSPVIFDRIRHRRGQGALGRWVVRHQTGWRSFFTASVGGALLLANGSYRFAKTWLTNFELFRRVLAYLFKREINKKAGSRGEEVLKPLPSELREQLSPDRLSSSLVTSVADAQVRAVIERINAPGSGVFAIVGERGAGKSTLLERIARQATSVRLVSCPFGGMDRFCPALLRALDEDPHASLEYAAERAEQEEGGVGLLIDDAHRLISPSMGGLADFDRMLQIARHNSRHTTWVFAFDEGIWQFFERMRGSRPLFDTVIYLDAWRERGIANLLTERSRDADIDADFTSLIGDLPPDADDIDVADALERTEIAYYRLIWDYAGGNPGVALTAWRDSLGVDTSGRLSVQVFRAPDAEDLEGLPESTMFVFRAIVQLERANVEQICRATGIAAREVEDAVRFGLARGYFELNDDGYGVTWPWFRAITRLLRRRHLLVPRPKEVVA